MTHENGLGLLETKSSGAGEAVGWLVLLCYGSRVSFMFPENQVC